MSAISPKRPEGLRSRRHRPSATNCEVEPDARRHIAAREPVEGLAAPAYWIARSPIPSADRAIVGLVTEAASHALQSPECRECTSRSEFKQRDRARAQSAIRRALRELRTWLAAFDCRCQLAWSNARVSGVEIDSD
jgi:hypothetical protein